DGRDFRIFQRATATVRHVLGEFYWKVTVGEQVDCADYVAPPDMISEEVSRVTTETGQMARTTAREVNFSLGTYVLHVELEQAFRVSNLPRAFGVAPNQPSPVDRRLYLSWAGFIVALIALDMAFTTSLSKEVDQGLFAVCLLAVSVLPLGAAVYAW